ncbi:MAG: UvrABC system protein A [Chlamydiia bacterium]|nr:UvrABC system protein A [Chlamydiia bacterium]
MSNIEICNAKENNLKNIYISIPKGKLVVFAGPSGSGKTTLATKVLQTECIRQYLESLGMITDHLSKPQVDQIINLSPTIGVAQRVSDINPRSTVGSKSGLLTILRTLFAAIGVSNNKLSQPVTLAHFSPNTAKGACPSCKGTKEQCAVDLTSLLDPTKSIFDGGVLMWDQKMSRYYGEVLRHSDIDPSVKIQSFSDRDKEILLYGTGKRFKKVSDGKFDGLVQPLLANYKKGGCKSSKRYIKSKSCPICSGTGLGPVGREVKIDGLSIDQVAQMPLTKLFDWLRHLEATLVGQDKRAFKLLQTALFSRIEQLIDIGLGYLTLQRTCPSLSAGEQQRLRLAGLLESGLTGVIYVFDEPSSGLHPHDTQKLFQALRKLQYKGNTVIVIEHDLNIIRQGDTIVEFGPGGGERGGEIIAQGTPEELIQNPQSIIGQFLKQKSTLGEKKERGNTPPIVIKGASEHNLKAIDVHLPTQQLVVLTGVSGSGKSTFLFDILAKRTGKHQSIKGLEQFSRIVQINQKTLSKSMGARSNIATYTNLYDHLRLLYASQPTAKAAGFDVKAFSFNISRYRCTECLGTGTTKLDMAFLPDLEVECHQCQGNRFDQSLLKVKYRGQTITDLLKLSVSEAINLFQTHLQLHHILSRLEQVGLGYISLGRSISTLSGGEAQRIKLAAELAKTSKRPTLYLLDEPTAGLHPTEVEKLLSILTRLIDQKHTLIAIEHNLQFISQAHTIIDFGPGGGHLGGQLLANTTPHQLLSHPTSLTAKALAAHLLSV